MEDMWLCCALVCLTVGMSWGPDLALMGARVTGSGEGLENYLHLVSGALKEA